MRPSPARTAAWAVRRGPGPRLQPVDDLAKDGSHARPLAYPMESGWRPVGRAARGHCHATGSARAAVGRLLTPLGWHAVQAGRAWQVGRPGMERRKSDDTALADAPRSRPLAHKAPLSRARDPPEAVVGGAFDSRSRPPRSRSTCARADCSARPRYSDPALYPRSPCPACSARSARLTAHAPIWRKCRPAAPRSWPAPDPGARV